MNNQKIIPAALIREAVKPKEKDYDKIRVNLNNKIQEEKHKGYLFVMTLPEVIVNELIAAGYTVNLCKAWHMGDVDTHEISWK